MRRTIGWLVIAILMFAVSVILYSSVFAQTVRRVAFSKGRARLVFSDSAPPGEPDNYVIRLKRGQRCRIEVEWKGADVDDEGQGLSGYTIVYPSGERVVDPQDDALQAKSDGDFRIVVAPAARKTNYRYRIIFTRF